MEEYKKLQQEIMEIYQDNINSPRLTDFVVSFVSNGIINELIKSYIRKAIINMEHIDILKIWKNIITSYLE